MNDVKTSWGMEYYFLETLFCRHRFFSPCFSKSANSQLAWFQTSALGTGCVPSLFSRESPQPTYNHVSLLGDPETTKHHIGKELEWVRKKEKPSGRRITHLLMSCITCMTSSVRPFVSSRMQSTTKCHFGNDV